MRKFLSLLLVAGFLNQVIAQTNPTPQTLPFELAGQTGSQLPAGVAVHRFGTTSGAIPTTRTTNPANGDLIHVTLGTSGGWRAESGNGISILASGSQSAGALLVSINTLGSKDIKVGWVVRTILQQASRDNSIALQYRVGSSGNFINVGSASTYSSTGNPVGHSSLFEEFLPKEAENHPEVQLRWIYWESVSTSGSRDRLAVDDISITGNSSGDTEAPAVSSLFPADGASAVVPTNRPSIQFSEAILPHEGGIVLKDLTRGLTFTYTAGSPELVIEGNKLTLLALLKPLRQYSVELKPGTVKDAAGNILQSGATWTFTTGEQQLIFDFNDCTDGLPAGFTQYSVSGAMVWSCTTFGQSGSGVQLNGFRQANEDWLISPAFDLSSFDYALLSYATRSAFVGPGLQLKVSTDYAGSGNPALATWTTLKGRFPAAGSDIWTATKDINLTAFKGENVYIAIVYTSGAGSANEASRWTLDDFRITKSATPPVPDLTFAPAELDFDYVASGNQSAAQQVTIGAYNLNGDLLLTAPDGFEVSSDNIQFGKTAVLKQEEAESNDQVVFVRFTPGAANLEYQGTLQISSAGLDKKAALFNGSSLRALKVVNWNIEWFGSPQQSPSNDNLQQQNVQAILGKLNADIYALSEVVDTARLAAVVASLPGYAYTISDFASYTDDVNDPDYATAQKLAFVYRSDVVKKLDAGGVLRAGGSPEAFRNWSSGRFPYLMKADVVLEGVQTELNLVLLHGKANTGSASEQIESWQRRKDGAAELKDSLDKYYPYSNVVILGDFNDDLDQTIAPSIPGNVSSYIDFLNDGSSYKPLTLPLSLAGQRSTVSHDNVIDHQVASNEMGVAYVPGSVKIMTQVSSWISSYGSTTSDHYPVAARYDLRFFANPVDLTRFDGVVEGSKVAFGWSTAHEINSRYFVIERSRNGKDFEPVDSTAGAGDSRTATTYSLNYAKPWPGQSHYRLRTVSLDGSMFYSDVLTINMKSNSHLLQVNTANRTEAVMAYRIEEAESAVVQLYDLNGRMYFEKRMNFEKGSNIRRIDTRHLPTGIYLVRVVRSNGSETEKVFIGK